MHIYKACLLLVIMVSLANPGKTRSQNFESEQTSDDHSIEHIVNTEKKLLSELTDEESEWYERFKEGVMFLDGWNEISDDIMGIFPEGTAEEKEIFVRMLGIKIGSEWCRNNEVRRIDTDKLKEWGEKIRNAVAKGPEFTEKILREIDSEVDRLLELSDRKALFAPQS